MVFGAARAVVVCVYLMVKGRQAILMPHCFALFQCLEAICFKPSRPLSHSCNVALYSLLALLVVMGLVTVPVHDLRDASSQNASSKQGCLLIVWDEGKRKTVAMSMKGTEPESRLVSGPLLLGFCFGKRNYNKRCHCQYANCLLILLKT